MAKASITLDGKEWVLRYDMNALSELEGALHFTMAEIGVRFKRGRVGTRDIRALVWAGLLHEDEDVTIRQVGNWLTETGFLKDEKTRDDLLDRVFDALAASFPEAAKNAKKDAKDPN